MCLHMQECMYIFSTHDTNMGNVCYMDMQVCIQVHVCLCAQRNSHTCAHMSDNASICSHTHTPDTIVSGAQSGVIVFGLPRAPDDWVL